MTTAVPASEPLSIGVGLDTARYGHHVTFLREDLQPACRPQEFTESRQGYNQLARQFEQLQQRFGAVHFHIRLDAAGQYAANLEAFLRQLPYAKTLTVGEPTRNQNYRKALFPKRKADPIESLCAARFALLEKPTATPVTPVAYYHLREIVQRLQGQCRHCTRLTNQLHNLLARVFPELPVIAADLQARWVLQLLAQYPTPHMLARTKVARLADIAFLPEPKAHTIHTAAATTVASFDGATAATLVRQAVKGLRASLAAETKLLTLLTNAYQKLPEANHLDSIPGIGIATAAVLTAKIVSIERFATAAHLVSYFGIFPEQDASGIDKQGNPKPGRHTHMSRKGNDFVRKYLWNAAKAAIRCNPAVRPLYQRLRARGTRGDVALGRCMGKLLHLVFAVWRTGTPFDPDHYPWHNAAAAAAKDNPRTTDPSRDAAKSSPEPSPTGSIDYAALRSQVTMQQVLEHLGHLNKLTGTGVQRRGPCPIHVADNRRHRSFSVNLEKNLFQCFHPSCAAHGNVLDLWAAVHDLPLYEAARHLANTFHVPLDSPNGTGKRNP